MNATKKRMAGRVKRNPVRAVVFLMIRWTFLVENGRDTANSAEYRAEGAP
jgi:hypothetical protein